MFDRSSPSPHCPSPSRALMPLRSSAIRHLPFAICHLLFPSGNRLSVFCYLLFAIRDWVFGPPASDGSRAAIRLIRPFSTVWHRLALFSTKKLTSLGNQPGNRNNP